MYSFDLLVNNYFLIENYVLQYHNFTLFKLVEYFYSWADFKGFHYNNNYNYIVENYNCVNNCGLMNLKPYEDNITLNQASSQLYVNLSSPLHYIVPLEQYAVDINRYHRNFFNFDKLSNLKDEFGFSFYITSEEEWYEGIVFHYIPIFWHWDTSFMMREVIYRSLDNMNLMTDQYYLYKKSIYRIWDVRYYGKYGWWFQWDKIPEWHSTGEYY